MARFRRTVPVVLRTRLVVRRLTTRVLRTLLALPWQTIPVRFLALFLVRVPEPFPKQSCMALTVNFLVLVPLPVVGLASFIKSILGRAKVVVGTSTQPMA